MQKYISRYKTGLPYPMVLSESQSISDHLAWCYPHKSSDFPEITTTKDYFCIYSTDHDTNAVGKILWGEMDDLEYNGFVENGIIVNNGYQSEFGWLIRIPTSESGLATDTIFFYFHTGAADPSNVSGMQETHLWTSAGGALHSTTWNDQGKPLGNEAGDNHTGYLRVWKRGVNDYIGNHLIEGGGSYPYTDLQQISYSVDGLNWTRGTKYSCDLNMPANGYFWRSDIQPFYKDSILYGIITYRNSGVIYVALVELSETTYLPETFIKTIEEVSYREQTAYFENNVMNIYLSNQNEYINETFPTEASLYLFKYAINRI